MSERVKFGLTTNSPHELQKLLYPLYTGIKQKLRAINKSTADGEYILTLEWVEK